MSVFSPPHEQHTDSILQDGVKNTVCNPWELETRIQWKKVNKSKKNQNNSFPLGEETVEIYALQWIALFCK